jgi:hypothetical protein
VLPDRRLGKGRYRRLPALPTEGSHFLHRTSSGMIGRMRWIHLDVLGLGWTLAACATPVGRPPATTAQPERAAQPEANGQSDTSALLAAVGTYLDRGDPEEHVVALDQHHGNWWLLADDYLVSVWVERRGADFVLRPLHPLFPSDEEKAAAEALPHELVFHPGSAGEPAWRYEAGAWHGRRFDDPAKTGFPGRGDNVRLLRRDFHELRLRDLFRRDVALLREPTPERLAEATRGLYPQAVAAAGGPERLVADELAEALGKAEESVPGSERVWFARNRRLLAPAGAARPALWPASEDARMLELLTLRYRSQDTIEIADGWLAKSTDRDEGRRRGCMAGLVHLDPTCSRPRGLYVASVAEPGQIVGRCYAFLSMSGHFVSEHGEDVTRYCQFHPVAGHAYKGKGDDSVLLLVDAKSRIVGARVQRSADLFVVPGASDDLVREMLTVVAKIEDFFQLSW